MCIFFMLLARFTLDLEPHEMAQECDACFQFKLYIKNSGKKLTEQREEKKKTPRRKTYGTTTELHHVEK